MSCRNLPCYYCEVEREESYSQGGTRFSSCARNYDKCETHFPKNSKQTEGYGECLYCLHEKEKSDNMHSNEIKGYFDCRKHNPRWRSTPQTFNVISNGIFNRQLHEKFNFH